MLWHNLGASYGDRAALTGSTRDFERSVALYERAIPHFDPVTDRQALARARSNMGNARTSVARARLDLAAHDAALGDLRASAASFEGAGEVLDAAFAHYRLAKSLGSKATTADVLAGRLPPAEQNRRSEFQQMARAARADGLKLLARAIPVFERAGASYYLSIAREAETEIRQAVDRTP